MPNCRSGARCSASSALIQKQSISATRSHDALPDPASVCPRCRRHRAGRQVGIASGDHARQLLHQLGHLARQQRQHPEQHRGDEKHERDEHDGDRHRDEKRIAEQRNHAEDGRRGSHRDWAKTTDAAIENRRISRLAAGLVAADILAQRQSVADDIQNIICNLNFQARLEEISTDDNLDENRQVFDKLIGLLDEYTIIFGDDRMSSAVMGGHGLSGQHPGLGGLVVRQLGLDDLLGAVSR